MVNPRAYPCRTAGAHRSVPSASVPKSPSSPSPVMNMTGPWTTMASTEPSSRARRRVAWNRSAGANGRALNCPFGSGEERQLPRRTRSTKPTWLTTCGDSDGTPSELLFPLPSIAIVRRHFRTSVAHLGGSQLGGQSHDGAYLTRMISHTAVMHNGSGAPAAAVLQPRIQLKRNILVVKRWAAWWRQKRWVSGSIAVVMRR